MRSSASSSSDEKPAYVLLAIPPDEVRDIWPAVSFYAEMVADQTDTGRAEDILEICSEGDEEGGGILWLGYSPREDETMGVMVTDLSAYPNGKKVVRIIHCGGKNFDLWGRMAVDRIEQFAVEEGCDAVEIWGRKGWGRVFPDYDLLQCVFSKELSHV